MLNRHQIINIKKLVKNYRLEIKRERGGFVENLRILLPSSKPTFTNSKFKLELVKENNKPFLLINTTNFEGQKKYPMRWTILSRQKNDEVEYTEWTVILDEKDYNLIAENHG